MLTPEEAERVWNKHGIKIGNLVRQLEADAVKHESHRLIEVRLNCLHDMLTDLGKTLNVTPVESDLKPSVYGENGGK